MKKIFLILFLIGFQSFSYEVDQFTNRGSQLKDSTSILDQLLLEKMNNALSDANSGFLSTSIGTTPCDGTAQNQIDARYNLFDALYTHLTKRSTFGVFEQFANSDKKISRRVIDLNQSIYSTAQDKSYVLKHFGLNPVIKVNNIEIGTDKLGHFFDDGYGLYLESAKQRTKAEKINYDLKKGKNLEEGTLGITTTHVKSYGDMAANFDGTQFWNRLCGRITDDSSEVEKTYFKKYKCLPNAYLKCENGKWKLDSNQKMTLADYVNPAWDEGINCNSYGEDISDLVFTELSKRTYSYKGNPKQPCPAEPKKCLEIEGRYSKKVAKQIVNPICRNIASKLKNNESIDSSVKFDYTYTSQRSTSSSDTTSKTQPHSTIKTKK